MSDPNPFARSGKTDFLANLATSTMDTFAKQSAQQKIDDEKKKQIDYQLLMAGLETLKPELTPSQAKEIIERAVDIFKPKGHGGIKEKLKEVFGVQEPYQPQAGKILGQASGKPRAQVTPPVSGGTGDSVFGNVTLPPPPDMPATYEKTYRELDLGEFKAKEGYRLDKALAVEEARSLNRREERDAQNKAILQRTMQTLGIKNEAQATLELRKRAAIFNPMDPDDPVAMARAAMSLQEEIKTKQDLSKSRVELNRRRLTEIDEKIRIAQQRANQAGAKAQAMKFKDDPQWKGMWAKAQADASAAKLLRSQAAIVHSKFEVEGDEGLLRQATDLENQAEVLEADMQKQINGMEDREYVMSGGQKMGGVMLPGPPAASRGGGARKAGVKLTRAEILANGGTEKDIEEARIKEVLADP